MKLKSRVFYSAALVALVSGVWAILAVGDFRVRLLEESFASGPFQIFLTTHKTLFQNNPLEIVAPVTFTNLITSLQWAWAKFTSLSLFWPAYLFTLLSSVLAALGFCYFFRSFLRNSYTVVFLSLLSFLSFVFSWNLSGHYDRRTHPYVSDFAIALLPFIFASFLRGSRKLFLGLFLLLALTHQGHAIFLLGLFVFHRLRTRFRLTLKELGLSSLAFSLCMWPLILNKVLVTTPFPTEIVRSFVEESSTHHLRPWLVPASFWSAFQSLGLVIFLFFRTSKTSANIFENQLGSLALSSFFYALSVTAFYALIRIFNIQALYSFVLTYPLRLWGYVAFLCFAFVSLKTSEEWRAKSPTLGLKILTGLNLLWVGWGSAVSATALVSAIDFKDPKQRRASLMSLVFMLTFLMGAAFFCIRLSGTQDALSWQNFVFPILSASNIYLEPWVVCLVLSLIAAIIFLLNRHAKALWSLVLGLFVAAGFWRATYLGRYTLSKGAQSILIFQEGVRVHTQQDDKILSWIYPSLSNSISQRSSVGPFVTAYALMYRTFDGKEAQLNQTLKRFWQTSDSWNADAVNEEISQKLDHLSLEKFCDLNKLLDTRKWATRKNELFQKEPQALIFAYSDYELWNVERLCQW